MHLCLFVCFLGGQGRGSSFVVIFVVVCLFTCFLSSLFFFFLRQFMASRLNRVYNETGNRNILHTILIVHKALRRNPLEEAISQGVQKRRHFQDTLCDLQIKWRKHQPSAVIPGYDSMIKDKVEFRGVFHKKLSLT